MANLPSVLYDQFQVVLSREDDRVLNILDSADDNDVGGNTPLVACSVDGGIKVALNDFRIRDDSLVVVVLKCGGVEGQETRAAVVHERLGTDIGVEVGRAFIAG